MYRKLADAATDFTGAVDLQQLLLLFNKLLAAYGADPLPEANSGNVIQLLTDAVTAAENAKREVNANADPRLTRGGIPKSKLNTDDRTAAEKMLANKLNNARRLSDGLTQRQSELVDDLLKRRGPHLSREKAVEIVRSIP